MGIVLPVKTERLRKGIYFVQYCRQYNKYTEREQTYEWYLLSPGQLHSEKYGQSNGEHDDIAREIEAGIRDEVVRSRITLGRVRWHCPILRERSAPDAKV